MNKETKIVLLIVILLIFVVSLFYFVLFKEQEEALIKDSVKSLSIKESDLPDSYSKDYENETLPEDGLGITERYEVGFSKNSTSNQNTTNSIIFTITKFESIDSAESDYPLAIDLFKELNTTFYDNYNNIIGEESTVVYYDDLQSVIVFFRIKNVIAVLMNIDDSEEIPISTTVDYAKIIEDKINKSLD